MKFVMKKYILLMFVVLTAGFTSCSNDDISVEKNIVCKTIFKINPSTVIKPFTFEYNPGELQIFDENYELRVRLLLFGQDGAYVDGDIQYLPNYNVTMTCNKQLEEGSYIAVVITDLKKKSSSTEAGLANEYWTLNSDFENLSELKIQNAGYTGGKNKILGISYNNFQINSGDMNEVKIDVQPAGAIIAVKYDYPHYFYDVKQIQLGTNKLVNEYIFNTDGSYSVIEDVNSYYDDKRICVHHVDTYEGEACNHHYYNYYYVLPSKYNLKWLWSDTEEDFEDLYEFHSNPMTLDIKAGDEWLLGINLKDVYYYTPENVANEINSRSVLSAFESAVVPMDFYKFKR